MVKRMRVELEGFVQGVGFRPFVFRLAHQLNLKGFVKNVTSGVFIEIEGEEADLYSFLNDLQVKLPKAAKITNLRRSFIEICGDRDFKIVSSERRDDIQGDMIPDLATCDECLRELFDPSDRRYLYPFINCTNCGPRFTIIESLPYDRASTTMREFVMCEECQKEYEDPLTRRFHAQPNACNMCGPSYVLVDSKGVKVDTHNPFELACEMIKNGEIIAVKGIGGFHLVCDATNSLPIEKLRKAKLRPYKPFAIMVKDREFLSQIVELESSDWELLNSPSAPIILLKKTRECEKLISPLVAPGLMHLGVMCPYAPVHHLLFFYGGFLALIATSANCRDEPITIDNSEAVHALKDIALFFLIHNRRIHNRADDSVMAKSKDIYIMVRRSRGFTPESLSFPYTRLGIMGTGAEEKATFTLCKSGKAFTSQFIGDLDNLKAIEFYKESFEKFKYWLKIEPEIIASDLHPDFFTTSFAQEHGKINLQVQHHYAHLLAVLAEHNINSGQYLGIAFDGFGLGFNREYWGGEFLIFDCYSFKRVGSLYPFKAISPQKLGLYPNRSALSMLLSADIDPPEIVASSFSKYELENIKKHFLHEKTIATSMGRLFDAVASILGICQINTYESEAPQRLEAEATKGTKKTILPFELVEKNGFIMLDWRPIIQYLLSSKINKQDLALSFHYTIAVSTFELVRAIKARYNFDGVVISGGCFQNRILLCEMKNIFENQGYPLLYPVRFPPNDGAISLGQAFFAAHYANKNLA